MVYTRIEHQFQLLCENFIIRGHDDFSFRGIACRHAKAAFHTVGLNTQDQPQHN